MQKKGRVVLRKSAQKQKASTHAAKPHDSKLQLRKYSVPELNRAIVQAVYSFSDFARGFLAEHILDDHAFLGRFD
jgi:hypothetical protein